eukprot:gb/GEZN01011860.1/.p1 GENE.gb/GEZN01011860.1/~~gb/GEZN01011860.1/.p1  ORF type:complete len:340 (+),score=43.66 gb/GEZN01011860.1/:33-1052(+)
MQCQSCSLIKLSDDFQAVSAGCEHPPKHCVECCLGRIKGGSLTCPHSKCTAAASEAELKALRCILEGKLVSIIEKESKLAIETVPAVKSVSLNILVVLLDGASVQMKLQGVATLQNLQDKVCNDLKVRHSQQRLLHAGKPLKPGSLANQGVYSNSKVLLLVTMLSVSVQEAKHPLQLNLHWDFPASGTDYLDGSLLSYNAAYDFIYGVDYNSRENVGVRHSGDQMTNTGGDHIITVDLSSIDAHVKLIVVSLSAWSTPVIGNFCKPSVSLFDQKTKIKKASVDFKKAAHAQAVLMCAIVRGPAGFTIAEVCVLSGGNAKDYSPIHQKVKELGPKLAQAN